MKTDEGEKSGLLTVLKMRQNIKDHDCIEYKDTILKIKEGDEYKRQINMKHL